MKYNFLKSTVLLISVMAVLSSTVYADRDKRDHRDRADRGDRHERSKLNYWKDKRFDHNRSYPRDGYVVKRIPTKRRPIHYRNKSYFYFGGSWYLPSGQSFVVVRPPVGIIVPILPSFYTTVWLQGTAYYYANDVYYVWRPDLNGYQVTIPPVEENQPQPTYSADEVFIYPKQGQGEKQQADDRYACHRWGVEQSSYDPTQPPGNLLVKELSLQREDYQRAMKACLNGKGYSVR